MTLIPFPNHTAIFPAVGPDYKVPAYCERPGCTRFSDHVHHAVRKSFTGGDAKWITYEGQVIRNYVGLCHDCHLEITDNKAFLFWKDDEYHWFDQGDEEPAIDRGAIGRERSGLEREGWDIPAVGPGAVEKCPTCKRKLPKPEEGKKEEKRPRRTWSITVPVDERENGALVLDELLNECSEFFGHESGSQTRYFSLVQALALVVQNGHKLVADE